LVAKQYNMEFKVDQLNVRVYANRKALGEAAASLAAAHLQQLTSTRPGVNVIFAAAPSQNEFLEALSQKNINWQRVNAFHMDEYIGLPADAPQSFGNFLRTHIFNKVSFGAVHYLDAHYAELLAANPPDIVFMGIGENTHIAFNDPHVADFEDPLLVKKVELDEACRQQQVNDGCFATINDVPTHALTLTVPALMQAKAIYCMVPGPTKREAVRLTLTAPVSARYPATILRQHNNAVLFLDQESYPQ
jgi:glucosamine-6-phosphate deaminase